MRSLQNLCLVIGATALGSAWGFVAVAPAGALTVFRARSGEDWGTALGVLFTGACCGAPLGALAGLAGALGVARAGGEGWSAAVWVGVALGVALGPPGYYLGAGRPRFDLMNVLIVAVVTASSGTLVGMLAAAIEGLWRRAGKGRSRSVTPVLGLLFALVTVITFLGRQLTGFQLALSALFGVPILYGSVTWLRVDGGQTGG